MPSNQINFLNLQFGFGTTANYHNSISELPNYRINNAVAKNALDIIQKDGSLYSKAATPTSINPLISGNALPGKSRLSWLSGRNKCNIFIGEALTRAGMATPMYKMNDGTYHYVNAENLPKYRSYFHILKNKKDIRPGDIMIVDYKFARSENGAHAEVVTNCDYRKDYLQTAGAHKDGAYLKNNSGIYKKIGENLSTENFLINICANVYFLRPKMRLTN